MKFIIDIVYSWTQPRTQALYSTLLPRLRKDPGSGWSRVSQILGDYKKIHKGGWLSLFCQSTYQNKSEQAIIK